MALAVAITDSADGTGGIATVSGSAVGSTNTVYAALFEGTEALPLTWVSVGSRTGDGTVAAALTARTNYLWYVKSVSGLTTSVSTPVFQPLTDLTYAPVRTRIAEAIRDRILLLALQGIDAAHVFLVDSVDSPCVSYPSVTVVEAIVPDTYVGGTNIRDDLGYPVDVIFQDNRGKSLELRRQWAMWVEKGSKAFRNQRLPGIPEVYTCLIEAPRTVLRPDGSVPALYAGMAAGFTIRAMSREVRGIEV